MLYLVSGIRKDGNKTIVVVDTKKKCKEEMQALKEEHHSIRYTVIK